MYVNLIFDGVEMSWNYRMWPLLTLIQINGFWSTLIALCYGKYMYHKKLWRFKSWNYVVHLIQSSTLE